MAKNKQLFIKESYFGEIYLCKTIPLFLKYKRRYNLKDGHEKFSKLTLKIELFIKNM